MKTLGAHLFGRMLSVTSAAFLLSLSTGTANAQSHAQIIPVGVNNSYDSAERIKAVNLLRAMSEQAAAAACSVTAGISTDYASTVLAQTTETFDRYISALRNGDAELGIVTAESNRRILSSLDEIEAQWTLMDTAVTSVLADNSDVEGFYTIDRQLPDMMKLTSGLMTTIVGQYAQPFQLTARDALLLEIAGRQQILTQTMAKSSCKIWTGYDIETAADELQLSMNIFEGSLNALLNGFPAAGIIAAPTDDISDGLANVLANWQIIKANQQALLDGQTLDDAQKAAIFADQQNEMDTLGVVIARYRDYAERVY